VPKNAVNHADSCRNLQFEQKKKAETADSTGLGGFLPKIVLVDVFMLILNV
jgi:hypothetical protein